MLAASSACVIPVRTGDRLCCCHLSEFPHGDLLQTKQTKTGPIHLYAVPPGVQVLALQSGRLAWSPVSYWSVHPDREVVIATLQSGRQIVTDDHPRAVFGVAPGSLDRTTGPSGFPTYVRATPTAALAGRMLVPVLRSLPSALEPDDGTAEDGYLLGVLAAHGSVSPGCLRLGKSDEAVLAPVIAGLKRRFPEVRAQRRKNRPGVTYLDGPLCAWVGSQTGFGEVDGRFLPPGLLARSWGFREGLLAALLDTKGSVNCRRAGADHPAQMQASFFSVNLRLVQETQLLARSLGLPARITATKTPWGRAAWMLSFATPELLASGVLAGLRHPLKLQALRLAPAPSPDCDLRAAVDLVPMPARLARFALGLIPQPREGTSDEDRSWSVILGRVPADGYLSRVSAHRLLARLPGLLDECPDFPAWRALVADETLTWDPVVQVEITHRRETGYDLTVPGSETFATLDGIVLSNTMSLHVPASAEAVQDIKDKLMASKMLFSVKDPEKVVPVLKQEQILGLYHAHKNPGRMTHYFADEREALRAIRAGRVPYSDEVEITGADPLAPGPTPDLVQARTPLSPLPAY